jgi:hypothetical protein
MGCGRLDNRRTDALIRAELRNRGLNDLSREGGIVTHCVEQGPDWILHVVAATGPRAAPQSAPAECKTVAAGNPTSPPPCRPEVGPGNSSSELTFSLQVPEKDVAR